MADLSITASQVLAGDGSVSFLRTAGITLTAGKMVYEDSADERCKSADADSATAAARSPLGITLNGASVGQPVVVLQEGPVTLGAILTPGTTYYLSPTAGSLCLFSDLSTGDYPVIVGIATSNSVLNVKIQEAGVAI